MKSTKYIFFVLCISVILGACQTVRLTNAGEFNMISHRNVDMKNSYAMLKAYAGTSDKELKKTKALSMQEAIDETVKRVPGGEFLMNVKFYIVTHRKGKKVWFTYADKRGDAT